MQHLVVFVNKVDVADPELLALVELETAELLEKHGYHGVPVVKGSALLALKAAQAGRMDDPAVACIDALVAALDMHVPEPVRDYGSPFLMPVEDVFAIGGRGTVVTGRVQRGVLRPGATVEIVGMGDGREVVVTSIEAFHRLVDEARAGENVGLLLRGVKREEVARGMLVSAVGAIQAHAEGDGGAVRALGEGGRPAHAVRRGLQAAVLLRHHRRDRKHRGGWPRRSGQPGAGGFQAAPGGGRGARHAVRPP